MKGPAGTNVLSVALLLVTSCQTFEAFRNDLFRPDGFIRADVEILFGSGDR